jgi:hypothetical protein
VAIEEKPGVPGVLAEHDVGRAKRLEHPERDVAQVPDRRCADRERHERS